MSTGYVADTWVKFKMRNYTCKRNRNFVSRAQIMQGMSDPNYKGALEIALVMPGIVSFFKV